MLIINMFFLLKDLKCVLNLMRALKMRAQLDACS